jgi:hypothetical protein
MAEIVYILCASTCILCSVLLYRRYRSTRMRLLFWSTCCFVCLSLNNVALFFDLVVFPSIDLSILRSVTTLAGMIMLLYGLIRERA